MSKQEETGKKVEVLNLFFSGTGDGSAPTPASNPRLDFTTTFLPYRRTVDCGSSVRSERRCLGAVAPGGGLSAAGWARLTASTLG